MRQTSWTARRKLFVSLSVLAVVLVIAAVAQFTGKGRSPSPYAGDAAPSRGAVEPNGERAVYGADSRPAPTAESPIARQNEPEQTQPERDESSTRSRTENPAGIDEFLTQWRTTVARGDLDGQAELYAPKVDRFFRQRNVPQAAVKKVKAQMMSLYPTVNRYDISDVKVESNNGREAVVSFRKEWDMNGQRRFAGAERQRLKLRRFDGDWKIVSEEETKIYWVKRG